MTCSHLSQVQPAAAWQPAALEVTASVRSAALVLCNDKPQTYGAPDVLQFAISDLAAAFSRDAALADRPPNQARQIYT